MRLSAIIPTLNEVDTLRNAVDALRTQASLDGPHQILVVDCGSRDGTPELARRLGVEVIEEAGALASRAEALNRGAETATGDVFFFLDADSIPPSDYDVEILRAMRAPEVVGGAFEFECDGVGARYRALEKLNRLRYRLFGEYYGDQGVFARAASFRKVGGFPRWRVMESAELCRRLKRVGALNLVRRPVRTSARRFREGGFWRVLGRDVRIWWVDLTRRSTQAFSEEYRRYNQGRVGV